MLQHASRKTPVEVRGVPLEHGLHETLLVQEFDLIAPDARLHVIDGDEERIEPFPQMRFFKGEVLGRPGSWAVLTQSESGVSGTIGVEGNVYALEQKGSGRYSARFFTRRIDDDVAPEAVKSWSCEIERHGLYELNETRAVAAAAAPPVTGHAFTSSTKRRLRIAVDTDGELTSLLGGTGNVATYVANITATVSVLYENDLNTVLSLGDVFTYANSGTDPWTNSTSNGTLLDELGKYWHDTPARASIGRSTVVLISGKSTGGGVAWLGVLCGSDFEQDFPGGSGPGEWGGGYAVWGSVSGIINAVTPNAAGYWDVLAYAHELGHNAGSNHTHCVPSAGYGRSFVDECYNGEAGNGCFSGTNTLPAEKGTIMSYCHLGVGGGYSNVRMIFGKSGEASEAVLPPMTSHINLRTLSGTLSSLSGTTVDASSTGNQASFSVTGATTYTWGITNGTITGGQGTSTVTYTAGASGTVDFEVIAANAKGCGVVGYGSIDIVGGGLVPGDFNGDGKADIIWRNSDSGKNAAWHMNGAVRSAFLNFPKLPDEGWNIVGTGDFNNDGKEDLVWRHAGNGKNAIWYMNGSSRIGYAYMPDLPDTNWYVGGVADFNLDGKPDLVWRHATSGQNAIWYMDNATRASYAYLSSLADNNWMIVGADDFDHDGKPDLVWRNSTTGQNSYWYMNNASFKGAAYFMTLADTNWKIVGVEDFNSNGMPDIVWRHAITGQNAFWYMDNTTRTGFDNILSLADLTWKIQGPR